MKLEGQKKLEMCTEFQQLLLNLNVYFSYKFLNIHFLVLFLINQRCNDIQRQTAFANIRVKSSLMFCYEIKLGRGREEYTVCWIRKERSGLSWLITSSCRLRGLRRGWERGSCPLSREVENVIHIFLKFPETKRWRYLGTEWLQVNEEVAYRKMVGCNSVAKLRGLGMFIFRVIEGFRNVYI
jgi:hypothetical protein